MDQQKSPAVTYDDPFLAALAAGDPNAFASLPKPPSSKFAGQLMEALIDICSGRQPLGAPKPRVVAPGR